MSYARPEGSYQNQSKSPAIRGFQIGSGVVGSLKDSINHFRGEVNFPVALVGLPMENEQGIKVVTFYTSNVGHSITTWNMEAPTGVMGLGWATPIDQIVVDKRSSGSQYDDQFYLVSGGNSLPLSYINKDSDSGSISFFCKQQPVWKILYDANSETWTIIKQDGSKDIYGDQTRTGNTVQFNVFWGNWIGNSILPENAETAVTGWNRAERQSVWGDCTVYSYLNDDLPVTVTDETGTDALKYTRASYTDTITDSTGRQVKFNYLEKNKDEYLPYHIKPESESAYAFQERYETKYLDSIEVTSTGVELYTVRLEYEDELFNYYRDDPQWKDDSCLPYFGKRVLKAISQTKGASSFFHP